MKQARHFWLKISCLSLDLKKNIPNPARKTLQPSKVMEQLLVVVRAPVLWVTQ